MNLAIQIRPLAKIKSAAYLAIVVGCSLLAFAKSWAATSTQETQKPLLQTLHREGVAGFIEVAPSRSLYVKYQPAAQGQPVVVLLNGLTYRVGIWDEFVESLHKQAGIGILRYDMVGQGATLLRYAPQLTPIPLANQTEDLAHLLDLLEIKQPVHLVALSYGGAVGMDFSIKFPHKVANLILLAPYVAPLKAQDQWIKSQVQQARNANPLNPATDDELYDFFLRQFIYSAYPSVEPIVLENPFKLEATFRLVQGVRKFIAKDVAHLLPAKKVHLIQAGADQYIPRETHEEFWNNVTRSAQMSRLIIRGSEHKIPESTPKYAAAWVRLILSSDPRLHSGKTFEGSPTSRSATSGDTTIENLGDE